MTDVLTENTNDQEIVLDDLLSYQVLCSFAARLLTESPQAEFIDQLIEQRSYLKEPPFLTLAKTSAEELCATLEEAAQDAGSAVEESSEKKSPFLSALHQDYTYLFYMVGASHTSPYESVYRTDDKTLFGPSTLEVREAYRAFGIKVEKEGSTPDDHLGYELSFLSHLLMVGAEAIEGSDRAEKERIIETIRAFLSDHVLVFAPVYLKNVQTRAQTPFYRSVAAITLKTLESMADAFGATATETIEESAYLLAQ